MMLPRLSVLLISLWVSLNSGFVSAVGLGNVYLKSKLHQPLDAEIELTEIQDLDATEIFPNLASVSDFERAGIHRPSILGELRFQTVLNSNGTGFIKVTSQKPIEEPFVDFLVEVHWPNGRLLREYTLLMDPPVFEKKIAPLSQSPIPSTTRSYPVPDHNKRLHARQSTPPNAVDPSAPQYPRHRSGPALSSGQRYQVRGNESLSQIAEQLRPDGQASVEQTMIALLRLNPEAFAGYNINRLKKGAALKVPDSATARALTHRQAVWQVAMHHEAWQKRKQLPMPDNASQKTPASVSDNYRQRVKETPVMPNTTGEDKTLLQNELMLSREQADQLALENGELRGRLQNLDQKLTSLNDLVMQQDDQMTELQASEYENETRKQQPEEQKAEESAENKQVTEQKEPPVEERQQESEPEPKPLIVPQPVAPPQSDYFGGLLFYALLLILPLAAGVGFIVYRRMRSENELDEELLDVLELELDLELDAEEAGNSEAGKITGDPLADADTHVTYGRFTEAVSVLEQAIEKEPARADLVVKLLEVYAENNDLDAFRVAFARLEQLGDPDALKSADVYKSRFPDDAFTDQKAPAPQTESKSETVTELGGMDLDLNEVEDDFDPGALDEFALDLNEGIPAPETAPAVDAAPTASEPEADIAFDLGGATPEPVQAEEPAPPEPDQADSLDFDLSSVPAAEDSIDQKEGSALAMDPDDGHGLDFDTSDLGVPDEPEVSAEPAVGAEVPGLEFDVTDLNLDISEQKESATDSPDVSAGIEVPAVEFESGGVTSEPSGSQADVNFDDDLDLDDELDDLNYLADDDEVAIKLDLARAYIDMGDKEGASDILDEVLEQGSTEQQAEAKELLDEL